MTHWPVENFSCSQTSGIFSSSVRTRLKDICCVYVSPKWNWTPKTHVVEMQPAPLSEATWTQNLGSSSTQPVVTCCPFLLSNWPHCSGEKLCHGDNRDLNNTFGNSAQKTHSWPIEFAVFKIFPADYFEVSNMINGNNTTVDW